MNRLIVHTTFGPLPIVGRLHSGVSRPTLLVITGAFPPKDFRHELVDLYPGANVIVGSMPGMGSPTFDKPNVANFSAAFDELIGVLAPRQPIVAYGLSTGCLVTLGLKSANVVRHVLEEPFFATDLLWPFIDFSLKLMRSNPDSRSAVEFLWNVFGISQGECVNRDYGDLAANIRIPTDAVIGDAPLLPRRALAGWPSLTSLDDLARLQSNPLVTVHRGPEGSGHHVTQSAEGERLVHGLRLRALHSVAPKPAAT